MPVVLVDDIASVTHLRLLRSSRSREDLSVLSASIACELVHRTDSLTHVLACWWIASKFEDVNPMNPLDVAQDFGIYVTLKEMLLSESDILHRINFCVPYKTLIRELVEMTSSVQDVDLFVLWLHVLMESNLSSLRTASEWMDAFNTFSDERDPLLESLLYLCSERVRRHIVKKHPIPCRLEMKIASPVRKRCLQAYTGPVGKTPRHS
jgi:hypothetical protein